MNLAAALGMLGMVAVAMPIAASLALGIPWALGIDLKEASVDRTVATSLLLSFLASLAILVLVLVNHGTATEVVLAHWLSMPAYAIDTALVFDLPAAVMMTLTSGLVGLTGVFSAPYLHQDPGYRRFFVLLPLFAAGMMAISVGGTLDLVYAGWEIVGISSALLIAYFNYRDGPVRHGLRAFAVYRICDVALLTAAVLIHHHATNPSLTSGLEVEPEYAGTIAVLLVLATMGKAASFPFTGWLPRAMEGPTPSSAIFYGALSIHAAPFLLIRTWPLLEAAPWARGLLIAIGAVTAIHASMVGRAQTDIKSSLGYASVAQVAFIMIEVGLGFSNLALLHMVGHAVLRTWQLLRSPSLLHDEHEMSGKLGGPRPKRGKEWELVLPLGVQRFFYRAALERWFIDDLIEMRLWASLKSGLLLIDRADRRWCAWLQGSDQ